MRIISLVIVSLFLYSCATPIKTLQQRPRPISAKEKLLEYYRSLRAKEWENRLQKQRKRKNISRNKNKYRPKTQRKRFQKVFKIKRVDENSQRMEIEQNLAFYCMKKRKSSKFSNEADCYAFTEDIKMGCLEKYEKGDARLTTCVKSRIKN